MASCEAKGVDVLFGLAGNARLVAEIASELDGVANKTVRGVSSIGDRSREVSTSCLWRPDNCMAATVSQYRGSRSDDENDYPGVHSCKVENLRKEKPGHKESAIQKHEP